MFYVFEEISWRSCRHKTVPLPHIRSAVSDGISPSPSRLSPDSNPPHYTGLLFSSAEGHADRAKRKK